MADNAGPVPDIGDAVHMVRRVTLSARWSARHMTVQTVPAVGCQPRSATDIHQGRRGGMTPYTGLVVTIDGETVLRMAGIAIHCRP